MTELLLAGALQRRAIGKTLLAGMPLGAASGRSYQLRQRTIVKQLRARALASGSWEGIRQMGCRRRTGKYLLLRWNQGAVVAQAAGVAPV